MPGFPTIPRYIPPKPKQDNVDPTAGFTTLAEFEQFARTPVSDRITKIPFGRGEITQTPAGEFRGGVLTGDQIRRAEFFQKEEFISEFEQKSEEAKAANLKRFEDIMSGFESTIGRATSEGAATFDFDFSQFEGLGNQAREDIRRSFQQLTASGTQDLVSSGLAGTTALGSLRSRVSRGETDALGTLNENLRREKIGTQLDVGKFNALAGSDFARRLDQLDLEKFGVIERREDVPPSQQIFLEQLRQFGNVA